MPSKTTADAPRAESRPRRSAPSLVRLHGPEEGIDDAPARRLLPGRTLVGREVEADGGVRLVDPRASRVHATLHLSSRSARVRVRDEASRNGTSVNGQRVEEAWLEDGDVLRFADSHFLLRLEPGEAEDHAIEGLLGRAPVVRQLRATIARVATHPVTVLLGGESGTGKELVARAIHRLSGQAGPFVAVNCAAIPEQLAESQLFGHVAGAFTGARRDHPGLFRAAEGGTLFLDEVGDLPASQQPKLLRALEERTVIPVGATEGVAFDVRILAATNVDLARAVEEGAFRGDLYSRISEFGLVLAPLRQRREDILLLLGSVLGAEHPPLDAELVALLLAYSWPFNVRELRAVATELGVRGAGLPSLGAELVSHRLTAAGAAAREEPRAAEGLLDEEDAGEVPATSTPSPPSREELLRLAEQHGGSVRAIARHTGRSRMQVYRWFEQHQLDVARFRKA